MTLYDLKDVYKRLYDALWASADSETGEVDEELLGQITEAKERLEEKAVNVALVARMLEDEAESAGKEIARLTAIKKRAERGRDRLKAYLSCVLTDAGLDRVDDIRAKISFRRAESVVVDDETQLPESFFVTRTERCISKLAIKEAIKGGVDVPGARLMAERKIQIK